MESAMSLIGYVRQVRPVQESHVNHLDKIQNLLTEADTGGATRMEQAIVVGYNINTGMDEDTAVEKAGIPPIEWDKTKSALGESGLKQGSDIASKLDAGNYMVHTGRGSATNYYSTNLGYSAGDTTPKTDIAGDSAKHTFSVKQAGGSFLASPAAGEASGMVASAILNYENNESAKVQSNISDFLTFLEEEFDELRYKGVMIEARSGKKDFVNWYTTESGRREELQSKERNKKKQDDHMKAELSVFKIPATMRNWEKKIVSNHSKSNCKIVGFIHCAITPRHLSLTSKMFYSLNEIPSIVITPSTMAYKVISKTFKSTRIVRGSFIRGFYTPDNFPIKKNSILFALTSNILESEMIVKSILKSNLQNRFKVEIRLNPNTSTFKKIKNIIESNNLSLFSGFSKSLPLVCLFRSSSTAIEYLSLGVNPIYINLKSGFSNNIFDLDNVYNFTELDIDKFDSFLPYKLLYDKKKCIEISNYYLKISNQLDFIDYIKD